MILNEKGKVITLFLHQKIKNTKAQPITTEDMSGFLI